MPFLLTLALVLLLQRRHAGSLLYLVWEPKDKAGIVPSSLNKCTTCTVPYNSCAMVQPTYLEKTPSLPLKIIALLLMTSKFSISL